MKSDGIVTEPAHRLVETPTPKSASSSLDLRWLAAGASLLFSALSVFLDPVINNDGILYLSAAEHFREGNWEAGAALFKWPFYSFAIGTVSSGTGLDVEIAAHVLNAILTVILVVAFVSIVREAALAAPSATVQATGPTTAWTRRLEWLTVLTILGYASLNDYRAFVSRDTGYLAFYLLGLLFLFRYCRCPTWSGALAWGFAITTAVLFRIEGVVFWVLAPLALLLQRRSTERSRWLEFARAHATLLVGAAALCAAFAVPALRDSDALARLKLAEPWTRVQLFLTAIANLPEKAATLVGTILPIQSADHAIPILVLSLAYVLVVETLMTLTPLHLVLVGYAMRKRLLFPQDGFFRSWAWCVTLGFGLLVVYVPARALLTGRYPLALCLTLLVAVPFSLSRLYESWQASRATAPSAAASKGQRWSGWAFPLAALLLAIGAVDGLVSFGATKHHLREAGAWIRAQPQKEKRVFSNDRILGYYAGHESPETLQNIPWDETRRFLEGDADQDYEFVALRFRRRMVEEAEWATKRIGVEPVQEFRNRRGDRVLIFAPPATE